MKFNLKNLLFVASTAFLLLFACDAEERGPLFTDGDAPGSVTDITFEAVSGGAIISYKLPDDQDVLLVRGEYTLANGEKAVVKSSTFNNALVVEGLLDSINTHKITLYAEDRGGNESLPVTVDVSIREAPIYKAAKTVRMIPDFGGVRMFWSGVDGQRLTLRLFTPNEANEPVAIQTLVKQDALEDVVITRGFDTETREFRAVINDRWGNKASPVISNFQPLLEKSVPKDGMSSYELPHDLTNDVSNPQWNFTKMWDDAEIVLWKRDWLSPDNNGTIRDPNPIPEYDPALGNPESHLVTIDLGRSVKLSRFKYWQDTPYRWGAIKFFDLWGTNETPNAEGTLEGWTKILSRQEVVKPSGERHGVETQEDLDTAFNGDEFIIPLETPEVRYIRFGLLENFIGTVVFTGQEFEFFGNFE